MLNIKGKRYVSTWIWYTADTVSKPAEAYLRVAQISWKPGDNLLSLPFVGLGWFGKCNNLQGEVNNIDHLFTMQCSAETPWVLALDVTSILHLITNQEHAIVVVWFFYF